MTLRDLAVVLGVSVPYLSDVETEQRGVLADARLRQLVALWPEDGAHLSNLARRQLACVSLPIYDEDPERRDLGLALGRMWLDLDKHQIAALVGALPAEQATAN
jgi:hypothetical protein